MYSCKHGPMHPNGQFDAFPATLKHFMLRQHDSRFKDQPSHDTEDCICPACKQPNSIESTQHVLLHCHVHERRGRTLRAAVADLQQHMP